MTKQELMEITEKLDNILGEVTAYLTSLQTLRNGFVHALEQHVKVAKEYFGNKEIELQEKEAQEHRDES